MSGPQYSLPPFRFDAGTGTLWSGRRAQRLRPRAAAVLRYLLEHPGDVVTPADILAAVWPGVSVSPGVVKVHVWEIRRALRDRRARPRFVETVAGGGYRWVAPVAPIPPPSDGGQGARRAVFVGRAAERATLDDLLARALRGERATVFVAGEPGIGKTALVDRLVRGLAQRRPHVVAHGQCIEHSGPGEAYLPVLTALADLGRGARRRPLVRALARRAPTWLAQLPDLLADPDADAAAVHRAARHATRERMLREIADALELLAMRSPLVLVLEDLQWSDASTLDLLALLARRTQPARLLLVATYRPGAAAREQHALTELVRDLAARKLCTDVHLGLLARDDVATYLGARLAHDQRSAGIEALARAVHERTEGNPLFMVNVVDALVGEAGTGPHDEDALLAAAARVRSSVPHSLQRAIEAGIDGLAERDRTLLEAASAVGLELASATLAAALEERLEDVERRCAEVARRTRLLAAAGEEQWADGTTSARWAFVHALYRDVLHERLTPGRRRGLHGRIAERLERGHGTRVGEIAATLALHFELAGEPERARPYLERAAQNALVKQAYAEAVRHLTRAVELLRLRPEDPARDQEELGLQVRRGAPLLMARGYAAPEVSAAYGRALELCRRVGDSPQLLLALAGIYRFSLMRSELRTAHELGLEVLGFAGRSGLPVARQVGHLMLGITSFGTGAFAAARDHLARSLELHDASLREILTVSFGDDPAVVCLAHTAITRWFLGEPDGALATSEQALALARASDQPQGMVFALCYAAWCRLLRGEGPAALAHADELLDVAREHDLPYWIAQATAVRGWALLDIGEHDAGVAEIRRGLAAYEAVGAEVMRPWHLIRLAEAHGRRGRIADGVAALAESRAIMTAHDERFYEAELCRIEGELRVAAGDARGAAERFRAAQETARRQGTPALELRAVLSLVALQRRDSSAAGRAANGREARGAGRALLEELTLRFTEGQATADLRAARALLADLDDGGRGRGARARP